MASEETDVDWMNPRQLGRRKLAAHVPLAGFRTAADALAGRDASIVSLDGDWRFRLVRSPGHTPVGFERIDHDDASWERVRVPHTWQMPQSGATLVDDAGEPIDRPIYANVRYPFPLDPPRVPVDENPTGHYRRTFDVRREPGRRYRVIFDGADSYLEVYLNGSFVGMSKDSRLPAEFDVTDALVDGPNLLACRVLKFCDGSYLEDQDMWRLSGLQRGVKLMSLSAVYIADVDVRAEADGRLRVAVNLAGANDAELKKHSVALSLFERDGTPLQPQGLVGRIGEQGTNSNALGLPSPTAVTIETRVPDVEPWSAETPRLYRLVATLRSPDGGVLCAERVDVGFRTVELKDGFIHVNGRKVIFTGVNRHEFDHVTGKCIGEAQMLADIRLLKQCNVNAVRTSHYPNVTRWYELCDEHGLYLIDEANLETHGALPWDRFARDPEWLPAYVDRAARMLERDKIHPSIVFWSLGNESGYGPNHDAMAGYLRARDPTRLVHYESCGTGPATDVICPMYASIERATALATLSGEHRPVIQCEYAHAMGNALGNISDYWSKIWDRPRERSNLPWDSIAHTARLQGGFIWDWADQGILVTAPDGQPYWAYGGDFGEAHHDGFFCNNGLVSPDRTPHPTYHEAKWCYQRVASELRGVVGTVAEVEVHNRYDHVSLAHLAGRWRVLDDGVEVAGGPLDVGDVRAGASATVRITLPPGEASLRTLRVEWSLRGSTFWADAGFVVAEDEHVLPSRGIAPLTLDRGATVRVDDHRVVAGASTYAFDAGRLSRWTRSGATLLDGVVRAEFYRAPTETDRGGGDASYFADWRRAGLDRLVATPVEHRVAQLDAATAIVRCVERYAADGLDAGIDVTTRYEITEAGVLVEVTAAADARLPVLPRVGLRLTLPAWAERVRYLGRGPHENYPDRKSSAFLGRYESRLDELAFPYLYPAERGGRSDARRIEFLGGSGEHLRIEAEAPLHWSAQRCTTEDLAAAAHPFELPRREHVFVYLDHRHLGVGGDIGWGKSVRAPYLVRPGTFRWAFTMTAP